MGASRMTVVALCGALGVAACGDDDADTDGTINSSQQFIDAFREEHSADIDRVAGLFDQVARDTGDMDIQGATRAAQELEDIFSEMLITASGLPGKDTPTGIATQDMARACHAATGELADALVALDVEELERSAIRLQDCDAQTEDVLAAIDD